MQVTDKATRKFIMDTVRNYSEDKMRVEQVVKTVIDAGGFAYAQQAMFTYQNKAFALLDDVPDGVYKQSLVNLVKFTTERNH